MVRGGYARTHDYAFLNIALNIASSFPQVATVTYAAPVPTPSRACPAHRPAAEPATLTRTVVADDFRSPYADQFSFELQRQMTNNLVCASATSARAATTCSRPSTATRASRSRPTRVDPTRGIVRLRANAARSWYDSLQLSAEQRVAKGFSAGLHYTLSRYLDTASEIFNISNAEVAVAQDSFDIAADKGRSSYDRPHRLTGNFVCELPVWREQKGLRWARSSEAGRSTRTSPSRAARRSRALNGADPTGALAGIDGLVGSSIRPNLNTTSTSRT